jgi:hypothetical protein
MRAADGGVLLLSAWLDLGSQPPHCRIKDWRYSLAVAKQVCDSIRRLMLQRVVCGDGQVEGDVLRVRTPGGALSAAAADC